MAGRSIVATAAPSGSATTRRRSFPESMQETQRPSGETSGPANGPAGRYATVTSLQR